MIRLLSYYSRIELRFSLNLVLFRFLKEGNLLLMQNLSQQCIRVSYVDCSKQVNASSVKVEAQLRELLAPHFHVAQGVAQIPAEGCDLAVIKATHLPEANFWSWLNNLEAQLGRGRVVALPALILSQFSFSAQSFLWRQVARKNWYFDIISQDSLDSIPLRMANLVRIHDHLYEILRYQKTLNELDSQLKSLRSELDTVIAKKER